MTHSRHSPTTSSSAPRENNRSGRATRGDKPPVRDAAQGDADQDGRDHETCLPRRHGEAALQEQRRVEEQHEQVEAGERAQQPEAAHGRIGDQLRRDHRRRRAALMPHEETAEHNGQDHQSPELRAGESKAVTEFCRQQQRADGQ